ncbi:hypothetical protein J3369_06080 [Alteromonas sp. NFXS44]|uniref:hypothetical protein n=1 Tax=Alteromonas sp. NFXS44 TaxID=2818435 RepID=UPI0032DED972
MCERWLVNLFITLVASALRGTTGVQKQAYTHPWDLAAASLPQTVSEAWPHSLVTEAGIFSLFSFQTRPHSLFAEAASPYPFLLSYKDLRKLINFYIFRNNFNRTWSAYTERQK